MKALGNLLAGKGSRALQTLGGQASPLLKFPTEQALGTQLFSGRKLEDLRPSPVVAQAGDLLQGMGIDQPGTKTQQLLSEVFAGTPFSRFGTTFGKLTDDRKDTLAKLLNITTGAQLTDVDIPKTQLIAARDQLGPLMKASPNVRAFEEFYVPKEKLKDLTPQELDAYMTFRGIEAKAKEEAKKRKANLLANPLLP
jgi:hypothetical protein